MISVGDQSLACVGSYRQASNNLENRLPHVLSNMVLVSALVILWIFHHFPISQVHENTGAQCRLLQVETQMQLTIPTGVGSPNREFRQFSCNSSICLCSDQNRPHFVESLTLHKANTTQSNNSQVNVAHPMQHAIQKDASCPCSTWDCYVEVLRHGRKEVLLNAIIDKSMWHNTCSVQFKET